jgi:hypothetical protein
MTKTKLKGRHFSSDAEVIAVVETWLDGQPSEFFFEWLAKVKSLVAVACFLPGRSKDLSAPRYNYYLTPIFVISGHTDTAKYCCHTYNLKVL